MIVVENMTMAHLDVVCQIELDSFAIPWSRASFERELTQNNLAIYLIAKEIIGGKETVIGYAGMWHVVTEGHITNVAISPGHRGKGGGGLLVEALINMAEEKEMIGITLEMRVGNHTAFSLYTKYGFKVEGLRKNYYTDTGEDALVLWKNLP